MIFLFLHLHLKMLGKFKECSFKMCRKNLVLSWEESHFMVKEGIVLGHVVSKRGIEVDQSKKEVIEKLPTPNNLKSLTSFLGHAGFYRTFIKDFSKIA